MDKAKFAQRLRIKGRWLVDDSSYVIRSNFTYGGKVISLEFTPVDGGNFRISFPSYRFVSKVSHYVAAEPEQRHCMNKALLFSVVGHLKAVGAWDSIDNHNFFRSNTDNKKVSYKEVSRNLRIKLAAPVRVYKEAQEPAGIRKTIKEATQSFTNTVHARMPKAVQPAQASAKEKTTLAKAPAGKAKKMVLATKTSGRQIRSVKEQGDFFG